MCKTTDLKVKKISHTMFDAGSLSLNTLKIIKINPIFHFNNEVDFRKFSIDIIDILFPRRNIEDL